jgi:hypothetical protein
MASHVTFVINPAGWIAAFKSSTGMVGQEIAGRTLKVKAKAMVEAPGPGNVPRNRTGINYSTGALVGGIEMSMGKWRAPSSSGPGQDVEGRVTSTGKHTSFIIDGVRPHVITSRTPGGYLKFRGRSGAMVYTKRVNHPGNMKNNFLERALDAAG